MQTFNERSTGGSVASLSPLPAARIRTRTCLMSASPSSVLRPRFEKEKRNKGALNTRL